MKSSSVVLLLRYCTAFALLLYLPATGFSQLVTVNGNIKFFVGTNQGLQVPDGIVVLDNAINILPPTLMLSDGAVLLGTPAALYKVHSVPDDGNAVFYSAFSMDGRPATDRDAATVATPSSLLGSRAGLTIVNGSSGVSDFTLKLDAVSGLGTSCLPVVWEVSQTTGSGIGDVTFTWDASLEPVTLTNKKLYKYASGAWTVLPAANTTTGTYSLTYSGYTDALSSTRFGIASGLSVTPTPTDPLCTGGTGSLTVSVDGGLGTRSYKLGSGSWQSSNQFTGLVAGTYTVYVKDDAGNEESSMVTITDPPPVTANVTGDLTVCSGESTTLTATGGTSYVWNGTLGTNAAIMVSPATTTTYSVSVTDANSCLSTASVTVQIYAVQPPVITYTDNTGLNDNDGAICAGSVSTVDITGGASYVWSDGSTSSSRTLAPACTTPYNLTVTDINGCTITANLQITVNYEPSVTQITPSTGSTGTTITINGKNLDNVSAVKFNGQTASGLTIVNATQLKANLPSGGALTQVQLLRHDHDTGCNADHYHAEPRSGLSGNHDYPDGHESGPADFGECWRCTGSHPVALGHLGSYPGDAGRCHGQCVGHQHCVNGYGSVFLYSKYIAISLFSTGSQAHKQRYECHSGQLCVGECRREYRDYRRPGRRRQQGCGLDLYKKWQFMDTAGQAGGYRCRRCRQTGYGCGHQRQRKYSSSGRPG
jgi:hypothetical protein